MEADSLHPASRDDSVTFNLDVLRKLEEERIAAEREAEARARRDEEARRAAAERARTEAERRAQEAARAAEQAERRAREEAAQRAALEERKARIDADARIQEQALQLELRRADAEIARAEAMRPKPRRWPGFVLAALLCVQGWFFYDYHRSASADREAMTRELAATEERAAGAEDKLSELALALVDAREALARAEADAAASSDDATEDAPAATADEPPPARPHRPQPLTGGDNSDDDGPGGVDLSKCDVTSPLGCIAR